MVPPSAARAFALPMALLFALAGAACGGGAGASQPAVTPLVLRPATASLLVGTGATFTATAPDGSPRSVTFRIREGAAGGTLTAGGAYLAPPKAGTYHVVAAAVDDPAQVAEAVVTVRDYANQVQRLPDAPEAFDLGTATPLPGGQLLLAGGRGLDGRVRTRGLLLEPATGTFTPTGALSRTRFAHTASPLPDGRVLIAGGDDPTVPFDPFRSALSSSELYDPRTETFTPGPALTVPRFHHVATALADGRILLSGGLQIAGSSGFGASPNTEVFDPATGAFTATGRMTAPGRWLHTATLLEDGRVLLVGGRDTSCTTNCPAHSLPSAELFDPATGTFTATGSLSISRYRHTATRLPDGRVLILGGETTEELGTGTDQVRLAELYDPATGTFTPLGNLALARGHHTATLLGNGKVLIMAGESISGVPTTATELLDPLTGGTTAGPELLETHLRAHALRLDSGEVLLLGGSNGYQPTAVMERFR